ncbi:caspase family protein [Ramlibacter albus]|uniref:Caspase family protein n=1 Tax=Ramlibacter albus TaxID=2079448 RepID=A0A923M4I2_9BURK|nr:caspase family protein [Ramlibacter albus]MBC5764052.1 caspase family protein [Ramlibacter albus]
MHIPPLPRLLVAGVLCVCCARAQAPEDLRLALVIGNAAYTDAPPLANPRNDAGAMADTLRGLGFDVELLQDADRDQMTAAIGRTAQRLQGKRGVGMLYYAGHGLQLDWRNYMVPTDARLATAADVPARAVDVATVLDAFRRASNRMNIVVLDACRDNPFAQAASGKGLAQLDAPPGTLLAYATAPGNVASDGDGRHGLYTQHLLQELVKPQSRIEDVFKRTRYAVRRASGGSQVPWEVTSLEEDFMFNAGTIAAVPQPDARAREQAYAREAAEWARVKSQPTIETLYNFLSMFPTGSFNEIARLKLDELQAPKVQAQAAADGTRESEFMTRWRDGDRYEVVTRDGLNGAEMSRSTYEIRELPGGEFRTVTLAGAAYDVRLLRSGHIIQDRLGTYDPPIPAIPGSAFIVGNRAAGRSVVSEPGSRIPIDFTARIVGRETIDTAFGPLQTYRVESAALSETGVRVNSTSWYDPAWGQAVRTRTEVRQRGTGAPDIRVRDVVARSRKG